MMRCQSPGLLLPDEPTAVLQEHLRVPVPAAVAERAQAQATQVGD